MSDYDLFGAEIETEFMHIGRFKLMLAIEEIRKVNSDLDKKIASVETEILRQRQSVDFKFRIKPHQIREIRYYIGNLNPSTTRYDFIRYFKKFGDLFDAKIIQNNQRNANSRQHGFVSFSYLIDNARFREMTHVLKGYQVEVLYADLPNRTIETFEYKTKFIIAMNIEVFNLKNAKIREFFDFKLGRNSVVSILSHKQSSGLKFIEFDSIHKIQKVLSE